jgi:hypothetical protein
MDKAVADYINKQRSPQKEIIGELRKLFCTTLRTPDETMAWGVITFSGKKFYIAGMKNRVHVGFAIGGLNENEKKMFEGSGKTMRHVKISTIADMNKDKLKELILLVERKATCNSC